MTREEAIKILTGYMGGKIDPESTELYHAIEFAVDILESQPSLPSNLDEAAHEFEDKAMSDYDDIFVTEDGVEVPKLKYSFADVFKAGAEWMSGQGETLDSLIWMDEDDKLFIEAFVDENKFNMAENVTIQIRKKL